MFAPRKCGRVQGWLSSVWGVAALVGPAFGGASAEYASWRWVFLLNLPIGAIALARIVRFVHETPPRRRHRIDGAGAGLLLLANGVLFFALLQGGRAWTWLSAPSLVAFGLAIAFVAALFGAIFNRAIAQSLAAAPAELRADLSQSIDAVIGGLHRQALPAAADEYLRLAIYTATHHVYVGLALVALPTLLVVLFTPRHFPARIEPAPSPASQRRG